MSCGNCVGSQAPGVLGVMLCSQNLGMAYNFAKYAIPAAGAYIAYVFGFQEKKGYSPFALSSDTPGYKMNIVETSIRMEGTPENDLMIAHPEGSEIFAKGGLNYVIANAGADKFFYSLCSTDIINKKIGVIQGFDVAMDQIVFFCTKKIITPEEISIIHNVVNGKDVTYIEVKGEDKISAIALLGDIPLQVEDIILNQKWVA